MKMRKITSTVSDDVISATVADDSIFALDGDDTVYSKAGNDRIYLGDGNDAAFLSIGNDVAYGNGGDDRISAGDGDDTIGGGDGNDRLWAGAGNDIVWAGVGDDYVSGAAGNDKLWGGAGNDTVLGGVGDDTLGGGAGNDQVAGGAGADVLYGGDGNDQLTGGEGNDILYGGANSDTAFYAGTVDTLEFVSRQDGGVDVISSAGEGTDTLYGIEFLNIGGTVHSLSSLIEPPVGPGPGPVVPADTFRDDATLNIKGIDTAGGNDMRAGNGLPVTGFHLATDHVAGVELGLKVQQYKGDYGTGIGTNGNYTAQEGVSDLNAHRADWSFSMSAIDGLNGSGLKIGDETDKGQLDVEIWVDVNPGTGEDMRFLGNLEELLDSAGSKADGVAQNNWNFGFDFIKDLLPDDYVGDYKGTAQFGIELRLTTVGIGDGVGGANIVGTPSTTLITNEIDVNIYGATDPEDPADTFVDNGALDDRGADGGYMHAGTGLPATGFHLATDNVAGVELGLKVQKHQGDYGTGIGHDGDYDALAGSNGATGTALRADWSFSMSAIDLDIGDGGPTIGDAGDKGDLDVEIWVDIDPSATENFVFLGNLEEFTDSNHGQDGVAQNNWNIGFDFIKGKLGGYNFVAGGQFGIELRLTEVVSGEGQYLANANQLGTTTLITNHIDVNVVTDFALV